MQHSPQLRSMRGAPLTSTKCCAAAASSSVLLPISCAAKGTGDNSLALYSAVRPFTVARGWSDLAGTLMNSADAHRATQQQRCRTGMHSCSHTGPQKSLQQVHTGQVHSTHLLVWFQLHQQEVPTCACFIKGAQPMLVEGFKQRQPCGSVHEVFHRCKEQRWTAALGASAEQLMVGIVEGAGMAGNGVGCC